MVFSLRGGKEGLSRLSTALAVISVTFVTVGYGCSRLQKSIPQKPPTPTEELVQPKTSARSR